MVALVLGCKPDTVHPDEVITNLLITDTQPFADGATVIDISTQLPTDADADKRNVVFRTTGGQFLPSNDTTITQKANFEDGKLISRVKFRVPSSTTPITITAFPEVRSNLRNYIVKGVVTPKISSPQSINIIPSSPSVFNGFAGEVQITATLKNGSRNVTSNTKVLFEDYDLNGVPLKGRYRLKKESSDANSTVSTFYSPGYLAPGTNFYIKCTYLDPDGKKTAIKDSCMITAIQP